MDKEPNNHELAGQPPSGLMRHIMGGVKTFLHKKWVWWATGFVAFVIASFLYLLATSPYSKLNIVAQPFTTSYAYGQVTLTQHYTPHFYSGWLADIIGYYKQAVSIVWNRLQGHKIPAGDEQSIIARIHALRFDPDKPYVITGDQFDNFYMRNPGVFYQELLNRSTALNDTDWHNRQRLAVQSLAYGLVALQQLKRPVTTLMPISPHGVLAVNIYSYPSDTMFALFLLMDKLEGDPATKQAALQLQQTYHSGLQAAYQDYIATVRDQKTGLVRGDIQLASARDAAQRQSSFYDNVVLWRTEALATKLGFDNADDRSLLALRQATMQRYWDTAQGHFIDDVAPGHEHSYSSDWLIALPTGFLDVTRADDLAKLAHISTCIDQQHLASPLPIRYTNDATATRENIFVKTFAGTYGNTAIWSYWGNLYITLEIGLYEQTGQLLYKQHAQSALAAWQAVIVRDRGFPETLDEHGSLLETPVYKSALHNGWVINYEADKYQWDNRRRL